MLRIISSRYSPCCFKTALGKIKPLKETANQTPWPAKLSGHRSWGAAGKEEGAAEGRREQSHSCDGFLLLPVCLFVRPCAGTSVHVSLPVSVWVRVSFCLYLSDCLAVRGHLSAACQFHLVSFYYCVPALLRYFWYIPCVSLRRITMIWDTWMLRNSYHKKVSLHLPSSQSPVFVCMAATFKIYPLKFQVYNTLLLIIITIHWIPRSDSSYGWEFIPFDHYLLLSPPAHRWWLPFHSLFLWFWLFRLYI